MADQDRPNQNANKSKAEGERFNEEERNPVRNANRPLSDEIDNQESLPERGTKKDQTRDPGARRQEGDYQEDER
jgi:hypothetical protein